MKKIIKGSDKELISVGDVSKSLAISRMSIIRMEKAGLLKPEYVSEDSGYRYYSPQNIMRIITVMNLQRQGFTYNQIREYLASPAGNNLLLEALLEKQRSLNLMLTQMRRTVAGEEKLHVELDSFSETVCYVKTVRLKVLKGNVRKTIISAIAEAVEKHLPLSSDKHVWFRLGIDNILELETDNSIEVSVYIPLRERVEDPSVKVREGFRGLNVKWFGDAAEIIDAFILLGNTVKNNKEYTPAGNPWVLCLGVDMFNDDAVNENIILNVVLPVKTV